MAAMLGGLENRFNTRMDTSDEGIHSKMEQVEARLSGGIIEVADDLEKLKERVEQNEKGLDKKIENALTRMSGGGPQRRPGLQGVRPRPLASAPSSSRVQDNSYKEEKYWRARRSLRLWPVPGPDLQTSLSAFMLNDLGLDAELAAEAPSFDIRSVRSTKNKVAHEVVVVFPDVDTRDTVRRSASNLAGHRDKGVRLEIPEFLRPSLRALESLSYMLKQSNPSLKRNVKFDDEVLDLVMDVRINEAAPWRKIRPAQALEAKKGRADPSREESTELAPAEIQAFMSSTASASATPATGANASGMGGE